MSSISAKSKLDAVIDDLQALIEKEDAAQKQHVEKHEDKDQRIDLDEDEKQAQEEQGAVDNTNAAKPKKKRRRPKKNKGKGKAKDISANIDDTPSYKSPYVEDGDDGEDEEEEGVAEYAVCTLPDEFPFQKDISTM